MNDKKVLNDKDLDNVNGGTEYDWIETDDVYKFKNKHVYFYCTTSIFAWSRKYDVGLVTIVDVKGDDVYFIPDSNEALNLLNKAADDDTNVERTYGYHSWGACFKCTPSGHCVYFSDPTRPIR